MPKGVRLGGRQKGTPNKRTQYSVKERLEELGVDLISEILKCIENVEDDNERAHLYLKLLEYCDAKRKAIEVSTDIAPKPTVIERPNGDQVIIGIEEHE